MRFSIVFVLASLVVSSFASTAADVKADIVDISAKLNALDVTVYALPLPSGTLSQALAIHTNAGPLIAASNKGAADAVSVSPNPLSLIDGRAILDSVEALEPTIYHALNGIVARFARVLPVGGISALVKQDLVSWNAASQALEVGLIGSAPVSLVAEATTLKTRIDAAFAAAIAAFP
ncbi:hypothetical protein DXG03_009773 [Asterophora parasitica]|uniref:Cell wall galactomannoprotein n=1 Tax=Asterophora parasitica TaxID=117018 RepID=A0A9P7FZL5_9AGAR|nr:hypothetical protein DXG03_009773 [Asterophora parasitica]